MAENFEFVLNSKGVRDMLQSEAMQKLILNQVNNVQMRCGNGYGGNVIVGRNRTVGRVLAETEDALKENSKNNTLIKAVFS